MESLTDSINLWIDLEYKTRDPLYFHPSPISLKTELPPVGYKVVCLTKRSRYIIGEIIESESIYDKRAWGERKIKTSRCRFGSILKILIIPKYNGICKD